MDKLLKALQEMRKYFESYKMELIENMEILNSIIDETMNILGKDTIGRSTINCLIPILKRLRKEYDEIDDIYKRIVKKENELIILLAELDEDDDSDSTISYGQKCLRKEQVYMKRK